jgi:hypothetical protein
MQREELDRPIEDARLARREKPCDAGFVRFAKAGRHDQLRQLLAARVGARPAEGPFRLWIPLVDAAAGIDDDDRLGRRVDHRREALAAFAQCALGGFVPRDLFAQPRVGAHQFVGTRDDALLEILAGILDLRGHRLLEVARSPCASMSDLL